MKKHFIFLLLAVATVINAANYCTTQSWGYCGTNVTGGGNATPTLVSNLSELKAAVGGKKPKDKVVIITQDITFASMLTIQDAQNITIMALPGVQLISTQQDATSSGILYVKRSSNIILRNITFVGPGAYDCDGNDNLCFESVTNAWVDHCDFQDGCDGNFDNKSLTDNITISWCRFHYLKPPKAGGSGGSADHRFTNLLGSKSSDKPTDGTYNITWAYCWWDEGCKERMTRCRNCEQHFLNCYWNSSVANYYVGPENAKCYFEGCKFEGKANTKKLIFKSYGGTNACKFVNCEGNLPDNSGSVSAPTYSYEKLSPAETKNAVTNSACGAGATLIVTTSGSVSSSCQGGVTPTYYTVTWDATTNGGVCSTATSNVEAGKAVGTLPTATKENNTFNGWYTKASGGDKITANTTINSNITFYAQFTENQGGGEEPPTPSSDLTWNFSTSDFNGLGSINATTTVNGLTITANSDKAVTIATSNKTIDGIEFTHTLKTGGTGNASYRNLNFAVTGTCTIDIYLVSAGSSDRTLNIYSGSYSGDPISTLTAPMTTPIKATYNYTGGATTLYLGSANSGINFYAINLTYSGEEPPTPPTPTPEYTLTYDENGGTGEMEEQTVEEGTSVTIQPNAFTAPMGYEFDQWNDNHKGSGTQYNVGQVVTLTADLILYAVWQPKTYTVTLNADGGTGGTESVLVTFDDAMPNITIPSRENYLFLGYFSETNGQGTQYYDANGSSTNSWTTPAGATLYAAWEEQSSVTPSGDCTLHFWFFNTADAETNGVENDNTVFTNMASAGSDMAGSITIDGKSYSVTRRTGDKDYFGQFTIPAGKTGAFYGLAVSSGGSDREINLVCGEETHEFIVPGGSKTYQRLESETLPAGTYSIVRGDLGNVRMAVVVVKICGEGGEEPPTPPTPTYFTVIWNSNGGECETITTQVEENTAVGELPTSTMEEHNFDGWFTQMEGGEQISEETIITRDTTFYAHYSEIGSGEDPTTDVVQNSVWWNISDDDFNNAGTLEADTVIRQLHILATPSKTVIIDGSKKSLDGYNFTHRLKLGGAGSDSARVVWFDVKGSCSLEIYLMSSSSNDRELNVALGSLGNIVQPALPASGSTLGKETYAYSGEATRIWLYSGNGGINIYGIKLTYPGNSTDVDNIPAENAARKILRKNQVLILREGKIYTVYGQLIETR